MLDFSKFHKHEVLNNSVAQTVYINCRDEKYKICKRPFTRIPPRRKRPREQISPRFTPSQLKLVTSQFYLFKVTDMTASVESSLCSKVLFTVDAVKKATRKLTFRSYNRKTRMFLMGLKRMVTL